MEETLCDTCGVQTGVIHAETANVYTESLRVLRIARRQAVTERRIDDARLFDDILTDYRTHVLPECHEDALA